MTADPGAAHALLSRQLRHQLRLQRRRMTWWMPCIFAAGFGVSVVGLVPAVAAFRDEGALALLVVFGLCTLLFGWAALIGSIGPLRPKPRIVPYFARQLGEYGGSTMAAFAGGRALYREIAALEELAQGLGVRPLSTFGFAYDHYEQPVRWHAAAEGLRTVEALRAALDAHPAVASSAVVDDLDALAGVLRAAAGAGVDFSLVLRLYAKDSMQGVCTRETRQGSFW